ncbi:MAG: GNAT family N-acetyltransferase [Candidatus Rokuibacteriota bacterium]
MKTGTLQIWDARSPSDRARWLAAHGAWPGREVFAHPAYVSLFAQPADRALCAFMATPRGRVLYPLIQRPIPEAGEGATDLTTPYGYGGPFAVGDARDHVARFWRQFDEWAAAERVVSEFVRLALFPDAMLPHPGEPEEKQLNVVRSLEPAEDRLWMDAAHKVRKNVTRARHSGVTIEMDPRGEGIADFLRIYRATMDRRGARSGMYFSDAFFDAIQATLAGHYVYFHARLAGRIVSSELVLVSASQVYSFLGGTDREAFEARPNDLLKYEVMLWAKRAGKQRFVLGGGHVPDDGIFRYKRAFAPGGLVPFTVVRRILAPGLYARLVDARILAGLHLDPDWMPERGFFPTYRSDLPRPEVARAGSPEGEGHREPEETRP